MSKEKIPDSLIAGPDVEVPNLSIKRFWRDVLSSYEQGDGYNNPADPFLALSAMVPSSGIYRDMTPVREASGHPQWVADKCTACGKCYIVCPDAAIFGLVNPIVDVFNTSVRRLKDDGVDVKLLKTVVKVLAKNYQTLTAPLTQGADLQMVLQEAVDQTVDGWSKVEEKTDVANALLLLQGDIGGFKIALTKIFHDKHNKKLPGSGGVFSVTINPETCKGCMECIEVCNDNALVQVPQTEESVEVLRKDWKFWKDLPNTHERYFNNDDIVAGETPLQNMMLDKRNSGAMNCGDGACLGCGEKTPIKLLVDTVSSLMQCRVKNHVADITVLIERLDKHIKNELLKHVDVKNSATIHELLKESGNNDINLSQLTSGDGFIHGLWYERVTKLKEDLEHLRWLYLEGVTGKGRSDMGMTNATGCTSVWGATYPFNPYPFPWANNLFQDAPSLAMGIFEGHMDKMGDGFKNIRRARLVLGGGYDFDLDELQTLVWNDFTNEEYLLCPPIVALGGDGAMYDIGFQNLSRAVMSGMPIKILIVDTQAYSNTGGQACTSSFIGQDMDMAPYGKSIHGKTERRKEMFTIAMGHGTAYVAQSAASNIPHLLKSYIKGLEYRGPAVWIIYAPCPTEHGTPDDMSQHRAKDAVDSRAFTLGEFDPRLGETLKICTSLAGNSNLRSDWTTRTLRYEDKYKRTQKIRVLFTFAHFAFEEGRFRKHFKMVKEENWTENMVALDEFIDLSPADKMKSFPYILVESGKKLYRIAVSPEMVRSTMERRSYWRLLQGIVGLDEPEKEDVGTLILRIREEERVKYESKKSVVSSAEKLPNVKSDKEVVQTSSESTFVDYEPVSVDEDLCNNCGDCYRDCPKVFGLDDDVAVVINAKGAVYSEIEKAAENCVKSAISPGTPF